MEEELKKKVSEREQIVDQLVRSLCELSYDGTSPSYRIYLKDLFDTVPKFWDQGISSNSERKR
jgi:hypothetical protein